MAIQKQLTTAYNWSRYNRYIVVLLLLLLLSSCGASCGLLGLDTSHDPPPPTRIVARYTPPRILQYCSDTYPLVPDSVFKSGSALVADMLDNPFTLNIHEGEVRVFASYIVGTDSYLKDAFSWSIHAIPDDPQEPVLTPTPSATQVKDGKGSSYDIANAQSTVQASNDWLINGWDAKLNANHALLSSNRTTMKQYTSRLRSLPNINDSAPEDVAGCLLSASSRMAGFSGRKTIIIASPLAENANTLPSIDLTGIAIEVINWNCVFSSADACIASRNAWQAKLLSFHAISVSIRDAQESQVVKPTF